MLEVKINSTVVDLPENVSVPISLVSPYLLYDTIPSNEIKPPVFPASPNNKGVFGYAHEPTSGGVMAEFKLEMSYNGELLYEGFFRLVEGSADKGYSGGYTEKIDEFFGEYQNKLLSELPLGQITMPGTLTATPLNDLGMPAVCFPTILNPDYYGTNGGTYTGKMNDHNGTGYVANTPLVPMVFVKY